MTEGGTDLYRRERDLPPLVARAVELARSKGFALSCHPQNGRLLAVVAAGRSGGLVGETGTGCGVGLAWMVGAASPSTRFVSIEVEADRAARVRDMFADHANVEVVHGDAMSLLERGPFDLLVLDGGPGKRAHASPVDPTQWLAPRGALVMDDFTVGIDEGTDPTRAHWLTHPDLHTTEVHLTDRASTLLAIRRS